MRTHLLALVLSVLLPALGVTGGAAWYLAQNYRQSFEMRLQDTARALALFVDSEIETSFAAVVALASSPLLERDELSAFRGWARQVGDAVGGGVIVNEAAPGHQQVLNTILPEAVPMPSPAPPGEGAWDLIRRVVETGQPAVSDLFVGRATGRTVVAVAAPAFQNGQLTRVVVLNIDPARLSGRLRQRRPSGSTFVSVADGAGRIVARSQDHERFLGTVPPSRGISAAERDSRVFRSLTVYGTPALFSSQHLATAPGWTVVVSEPYERYRISLLAPLVSLAAGAALALALGVLVATWLSRRILAPVITLARRAETVASGDEHLPLPGVPPAGVAEFETMRIASERAEMALTAREAEFRAIFETAAAGVAEIDKRTGRYLRVNHCFCEIVGRTEAELVGRLGPDDIAHPDDRTRDHPADPQKRILRPDGTPIWVQSSTAISAHDEGGRPSRMVTVMQNITERKLAEEARGLLAREVDHRAKNMLAVVQAVLRLTRKDDVLAYAKSVETRVTALARAHTLLADAGWSGISLQALAEAELRAFRRDAKATAREGPRVQLSGPALTLSPTAVQAISIVLHELEANAAKYGALSAVDGSVELSWVLDVPNGLVRLRWAERGGPPVSGPPTLRGFGSRVIAGSVRDQLAGTLRLSWGPGGLVCEIDLPLERTVVANRTVANAEPPVSRSSTIGQA